MSETPTHLSTQQCAARFSCSTKQIVRLIKTGRLPAIDIGIGRERCYRVPVGSLDALVASRVQPAIAIAAAAAAAASSPPPAARAARPRRCAGTFAAVV